VSYFTLVTASHGVLDALTDGGPGVAFFAPFDNTRYFFPWRPIEVSTLRVEAFLGARGRAVLVSEIKWLWLPCGVLVVAILLWRSPAIRRHSE
ncbi:MAG TPA: metal-dependent hydrolase, partial [Pyrinomonadaceae bacterium]|nr:metal-dependent hydrolase [Pyrinomonadaceae bacterium]